MNTFIMDIEGSTIDQVPSGYELLDKLLRRKQYVRSHVRCKVPLANLDPNRTLYESVDLRDMQIDGYGLMERTSIDPRRSKSLPWFEDNRNSYQHQADYFKRLSKLRDELVDQEQANLVNALERLRQRQFGKENVYSLGRVHRSKETLSSISDVSPRKSFVTTLEHFQKTRPKKSPPRIMPLEGKQIFEPQGPYFTKYPQLSDKPASVSSTSTPRVTDDTFRLNLQRLIQPTSSIPNIGRKSTSSRELVLESSSLQKKSTQRMFSNGVSTDRTGNSFKGVHKGGGRLRQLMKPDSDELDLPPNSVHFDNNDTDRLNDDSAKDYCIYYLPSNTPVVPITDDDSSFYDDSISEERKFEREKRHRLNAVEGKGFARKGEGLKLNRTHRKVYRRNDDSDGSCDSPTLSTRKIVVDMPAIVFNSATPDKTPVSDMDRASSDLRRTYRQNELRSRELKNLIEDVKELNIRSDRLSENIVPLPS